MQYLIKAFRFIFKTITGNSKISSLDSRELLDDSSTNSTDYDSSSDYDSGTDSSTDSNTDPDIEIGYKRPIRDQTIRYY